MQIMLRRSNRKLTFKMTLERMSHFVKMAIKNPGWRNKINIVNFGKK